MSTAYPNNLDNFSNPSGTDKQNSITVPHAEAHTNLNDALEAVQAALGIIPQGVSATVRARLETIEASISALGGSVTAALGNGSITSAMLQSGAVTEGKIADDAISANKLALLSVSTSKIQDVSVTSGKLASDSVTYDKVANSSKVLLTRVANQALAATTLAFVSWDTKPGAVDTDGFVSAIPNTTVSIPTAKAGLYLIVATVAGFTGHVNDYIQIEVSTGTANWKAGGATSILAVGIADIAVGGTVKVNAFNGGASGINLTGRFMMVKLFDQ